MIASVIVTFPSNCTCQASHEAYRCLVIIYLFIIKLRKICLQHSVLVYLENLTTGQFVALFKHALKSNIFGYNGCTNFYEQSRKVKLKPIGFYYVEFIKTRAREMKKTDTLRLEFQQKRTQKVIF